MITAVGLLPSITIRPISTLHSFCLLPTLFPFSSHQHILYIYKFTFILSFVLFRFHIGVKSYDLCLTLSDLFWLAIPSRSIHVVANVRILFFSVAEWYYIVYVHTNTHTHVHHIFFYPFFHLWTLMLFPFHGYFKWSCGNNRGAYNLLNYCFPVLSIKSGNGKA